jgi:hypothetical protein
MKYKIPNDAVRYLSSKENFKLFFLDENCVNNRDKIGSRIIFGRFKDFWDGCMYKNHVEFRVYGCDCKRLIFKSLGIIS